MEKEPDNPCNRIPANLSSRIRKHRYIPAHQNTLNKKQRFKLV